MIQPSIGLYVEGARYYTELVPELAEQGETELGYRRAGALIVSSDADELRAFDQLLQRRRSDTPEMGETNVLSARDARMLFPPLREDLAGLHVANGARVDGRLMAAGLLRAAQRLGARLFKAQAKLIADGNRVRAVSMGGGTIEGDGIVVTAGAWAAALLQPLGIALAIEPQRGQIVHLRLPGENTQDWPVVLPPGSHYLLAFDDCVWSPAQRASLVSASTIAPPRPDRRKCLLKRYTWRRVLHRQASSRRGSGFVR